MKLWISGIIAILAALVLQFLAREFLVFAEFYRDVVYPIIVTVVSTIFGIFPFSVVEFLLYLLVIVILVCFIVNLKKPMIFVRMIVTLGGILFFIYTTNCGINYFTMPFSVHADLEVREYEKEELIQFCEHLIEQVNHSYTTETYEENKDLWKEESIRSMKKLGDVYPQLSGIYPKPKAVTFSQILSIQHISGVYSPFTVEANFNQHMEDYNIPLTMAHELSHLRGFMREDEANYIGYLACINSDLQAFQYSGYLSGWIYAGNALASVDRDTYIQLSQLLDAGPRQDLKENSEFWARYDGGVAEVSNQLNDTYLKINEQEDGVQSYGRVVDLMLADFLDN